MVYPYQASDDEYYPIVKFSLIYKDNKLVLEALVGSGANVSIFGEDVADALGLEIESGKKIYLGGVGGRILGYEHFVDMEISSEVFRSKVVFSREFLVSFNLLGREGVFDRFMICFDEKRKLVELNSRKQ